MSDYIAEKQKLEADLDKAKAALRRIANNEADDHDAREVLKELDNG